MTTKTTTTKTKKITPAESIRRVNKQLTAQASADWRTWAIALANGEGAPDGRDLMAAATALNIEDAAEALEDDAAAILQVRTAEDCIEKCRRATDDLLDPWGGRLDKLEAAITEAKREVERLTEIHGNAAGGCSRSFWVDLSHRLRVGHPRVWSNYSEKGL
jgi:hypothetical protein